MHIWIIQKAKVIDHRRYQSPNKMYKKQNVYLKEINLGTSNYVCVQNTFSYHTTCNSLCSIISRTTTKMSATAL